MGEKLAVDLSVDDIEGHEEVFRFVGRDYIGLSKIPASLVPTEGRFEGATYEATILLSKDPLNGATTVDERRTVVVATVECEALNPESWLEIQTDRGDWNGSLTLPRERVPDWISEPGDDSFVKIELTYDQKRGS